MGNIFGHGRLRLYLLKLLDESPRHGYEIISLLRDRFLGVYSPSPGTIYPRLARLEEEGLVTHEEVNGRKVYRLTDAGREELRRRSGDLGDLERDLIDSAHEIARAVKRDVRHTITSLREELKGATGDPRRQSTAGSERDSARDSRDVWEQASAEEPPPAGDERRSERSEDGGAWWDREWERISRGFGSWGGGSDYDRTLRDFIDRVRGVVREAGHGGESALDNLRRILDDTLEAIRKDAAHWGSPPEGQDKDASDRAKGDEPGAEEPPEEPRSGRKQ